MEQARDLSESWKVDLASREPMCAQAESLSLVYCRHPDSSLVGDYRMSGDTTHAVNPSTCFIPRVRYVHSGVAPRFKTCFGR